MSARTFTAEFAGGLHATLTLSLGGMRCEWSPDIPKRVLPKDKRAACAASYRIWRDECAEQFAAEHGLELLCITVGNVDALFFRQREAAT